MKVLVNGDVGGVVGVGVCGNLSEEICVGENPEKGKSTDIQDLLGNQENEKKDCIQRQIQQTPYPGISELLPTLFLCGAGVALPNILDKLDVKFIINIAPELPDTPLSDTKPMYLRVNALDRPDVDLKCHFDEVADMIEEVHQLGGKSLVHCVAGVSRSASLCLAYLMKHRGMSLREAFYHVKAIRPQIRPNSGFFQQLRVYEEELRGSCSVKMIYVESLDREVPDVYEPEYRAMEEFYQRHRTFKRR